MAVAEFSGRPSSVCQVLINHSVPTDTASAPRTEITELDPLKISTITNSPSKDLPIGFFGRSVFTGCYSLNSISFLSRSFRIAKISIDKDWGSHITVDVPSSVHAQSEF